MKKNISSLCWLILPFESCDPVNIGDALGKSKKAIESMRKEVEHVKKEVETERY